MNCREFRSEAGDLSREPAPAVLAHLETCPECQQWLERSMSAPPVGLTPPAWEPLSPKSLGDVLRAAPLSPKSLGDVLRAAPLSGQAAAESVPENARVPVSPGWTWETWLRPLMTGLGSLAVAGLLWFSLQTRLPPITVPAPVPSGLPAVEAGPVLSFLEDLPADVPPVSGQPVEEQTLAEQPIDAAEGESMELAVTDSEFELSQSWSFVDPERSMTFLDEEKEESWL